MFCRDCMQLGYSVASHKKAAQQTLENPTSADLHTIQVSLAQPRSAQPPYLTLVSSILPTRKPSRPGSSSARPQQPSSAQPQKAAANHKGQPDTGRPSTSSARPTASSTPPSIPPQSIYNATCHSSPWPRNSSHLPLKTTSQKWTLIYRNYVLFMQKKAPQSSLRSAQPSQIRLHRRMSTWSIMLTE